MTIMYRGSEFADAVLLEINYLNKTFYPGKIGDTRIGVLVGINKKANVLVGKKAFIKGVIGF